MANPLIPQEIFLLERFSSLEYFAEMRDAFARCVRATEDGLADFMTRLPPKYRKKPLYEQPDIVWGERIIPNMQWALRAVNDGYAAIVAGEYDGLGMASNVKTTFTGIQRDYSWDWLPEPFRHIADETESIAWHNASMISITQQAHWGYGDLYRNYSERDFGPANPPESWPKYALDPTVKVRTDDLVPRNGIYLPDAPYCSPQFLIEGYKAWGGYQSLHPEDPESNERQRVPTTWTLVERIADTGGGVPGDLDTDRFVIRLRAVAGEPCPRAGFWFTPARLDSRRHFQLGEPMPEFNSAYGATVWQWDEVQG